jgi:uridine kinase
MVRPFVIGVTGGSGSGKTTFIQMLEERFGKEELCVFSQDNYYKPRNEQVWDQNEVQNFDLPDSFRRKEFFDDVRSLLRWEAVEVEEYTFNNSLKQPQKLRFEPAPIVVLEGIFVFYYEEIYELMDLRLFIDVDEHLKIIRRIRRDAEERNYPLDDVLYRYQHHVFPTFEKYIQPFRDKADMVINNNYNFSRSIQVFDLFLKKKLELHREKADI